MSRNLLPTLLFLIGTAHSTLHAQVTLSELANDTIVILQRDFGKTYLLNGKRLNQPVMEWFMSDFPSAHQPVRVASFLDGLASIGYTSGVLFTTTGAMVYRQNTPLAKDWIRTGVVCIGTGVLFQVVANVYRLRAVRAYNREILQISEGFR